MNAYNFSPQERRITLIALMVVLMLSALDGTVVGTAMPRIIAQLNGLELISWLTSAYMLTSTVLVPIYGKLSDLYGRKPILIIGVVVFTLGSALSGMSGEFGDLPLLGGAMTQLIVFRALQGVGAAALITSTFTIIADLYPPRERGKISGLFGSIFGLAMVMGPVIGGFLTDHGTMTILGLEIAGWRWVFYVNLPLGLLSLFMIIFKMPRLSHSATGRVDYLGALLLIAAFVPLLLGLTWGGSKYPWDSQTIVALLTFAAIMLTAFVFVEARTVDAILPLDLFRNPVFAIANSAGFLVNMAFLGIIMFLPLFMQVVQGVDATVSGWRMLAFMAGLMATSIGSGLLSSRTGRYKIFILTGCVVLAIGIVLLWRIGPETTAFGIIWRIFVVGMGLGPAQSMFNLAVQNAVPMTQIGIATSASTFFRQIGQTIGVTIFGALLTNNLAVELPRHLPTIPGVQTPKKVNLGQANMQAMNPHLIHDQIKALFDRRYQTIDRAFRGDATATLAVLNDPLSSEQVKKSLRESGQDSVSADKTLAEIKQNMDLQAAELTGQIEHGTKQAFSDAITGMFGTGLAIAILALIVAAFLPELPLRRRQDSGEVAAMSAA